MVTDYMQPSAVRDPAASIIVPAYNAESSLEDAVSSALNQTLTQIEVIIVDDASTDGTYALAERLAAKDSRVRVLVNEDRLGPAGARNKAIAHARGRWVALLDADDSYAPTRLERLIKEGEERGCEFIADNLVLRDADGAPDLMAFPSKVMEQRRPIALAELVTWDTHPQATGRGLGYCKPIILREFLVQTGLRYDLRAFRGQDFIFYFNAISLGARFCLLNQALYCFRVGHASHSSGLEALHHIAAANKRLLQEAANAPPVVRRALRKRDAKMQFEIFRTHARNRAHLSAMLALARVHPLFALQKFAAAAMRRVNPETALA